MRTDELTAWLSDPRKGKSFRELRNWSQSAPLLGRYSLFFTLLFLLNQAVKEDLLTLYRSYRRDNPAVEVGKYSPKAFRRAQNSSCKKEEVRDWPGWLPGLSD